MATNTDNARRIVSHYYNGKTDGIRQKYGNSHRIHYHLGLFADQVLGPEPGAPLAALKDEICGAQEALLSHLERRWDAPRIFAGRLLDVGCGLGGGAIWWAERCHTAVTGITIAASHLPIIDELARIARVRRRVHPVLADACTFQDSRRFDAAVALESSCYLDREEWFARLAQLIRPGGAVCIEDTFVGDPAWRAPFDAYWRTRIGPVSEYVRAARRNGFELEDDDDLTARTTAFWRFSIAWSLASRAATIDPVERGRLRRSAAAHQRFHEAWTRRGIEVHALRFRRAR